MLVEMKKNLQSMYDQVMSRLSSNNLRSEIMLFGVPGFIRQGNSYATSEKPGIIDIAVEEVEGADYGFELNADGYYESTNTPTRTAAVCKLTFKSLGQTRLKIDCINQANYSNTSNYGMLSKLDTTLVTSYSADSISKLQYRFYGNSSTDVHTIEYEVPEGEHFIYIKFRGYNYSSSYDNPGSLQFKVSEVSNIPYVTNEVVASAYFNKESLIADMTQPDGTIGLVVVENAIKEMYQKVSGAWQFLADFSSRARTFATIEEMNQHTDLPENTIAVVYGTAYVGTYKLDSGVWTELGDANEEVQVMNSLNSVTGTTDEYEGTGGTDEEISQVLNTVIGGNE